MDSTRRREIASRLEPAVEDRLRDLFATVTRSPAEIHRRLEDEFGPGAVSEKTVQRRVKALEAYDTTGEWTLATGDPASAGDVLDALAGAIMATSGMIRSLSMKEAAIVGQIRQARPDLDALTTWRLAAHSAIRGDLSLADVRGYLAFAPWRSESNANAYAVAVKRGWVAKQPAFMRQHLTGWIESLGMSVTEAMAVLEEMDRRAIEDTAAELGVDFERARATLEEKEGEIYGL